MDDTDKWLGNAVKSLQESESTYHMLFESLDEAIQICELVFDENGQPVDNIILDVNPAYEKHSGLKKEEVVGRRIKDILPVVEQVWLDRYAEVVREGKSMHFEEYNASLERWFDVNTSPLGDKRFVAMFTDVTEHKKADEQLKESEKKLNVLFRNLPVGISVLDKERKIIYENPTLEKIMELSKEELRHGKYAERRYFNSDMTEFPLDELPSTQAFNKQIPVKDIEVGVLKEDKSMIWTNVSAIPLPFPDWNILLVTSDITERKNAEEKLNESNLRLNLALESGQISVFEWNPDTGEVISDEIGKRQWGLQKDSKVNYEVFVNGIHPDDREKTLSEMAKALNPKGDGAYHAEYRVIGIEDGVERWISANGQVFFENNKPIKQIGTTIDITKRKKAEENLKKSEKRNRTLFETMLKGVVYQNAEGHIISMNPAAEKIMGYKFEELQNRTSNDPIFQAIHEDGTPFPGENHPSMVALKTGKEVRNVIMGVNYPSKDEYTWLKIDAVPEFRNGEEKPYQVYTTFEDITEQKKAYEEKEELNRQLKDAQRIGKIGSWEWNIKNDKLIWSDEFYNLIGRVPNPDGESYQSFIELIHPEDRLKANKTTEKSLKTLEPFVLEYRLCHDDGSILFMNSRGETIVDSEGNRIRMIGTVQDITDQKRAQEELRKAHNSLEEKVAERTEELSVERQRFYDMLELLPVMICLLTEDYHVAFANRTFRERFGESHGRHCYNYLFGFNEPCHWCQAYTVLETGKPQYWELETPDGSFIDVYNMPFTDTDGSPLILELDIDVTDKNLAEKQLKETIKELERSNRELQSFAYITSHDLQEPLRTIASFTQLLERRYKSKLDDDADEFMDYIVDAAKRMKDMIQGLLEYSRVNTQAEQFKEFNSEEAVKLALNHLQSSIEESNAEINFENLPIIIGDEHQIVRVFQNLISNALKFRKEDVKPEIRISSYKTKDGKGYVFSIADNGIGMEEVYSDNIFEPFRRLHTIDVYEGTGIGLAVVKRIVEHHGGRVWVESEFGLGSTFYFTIPIKE